MGIQEVVEEGIPEVAVAGILVVEAVVEECRRKDEGLQLEGKMAVVGGKRLVLLRTWQDIHRAVAAESPLGWVVAEGKVLVERVEVDLVVEAALLIF